MSVARGTFAVLLAFVILAGALAPVSQVQREMVRVTDSPAVLADTNLVVTDIVDNLDNDYDDDDFIFHVYNYTHIIGNANVSLYFSNTSFYQSKLTSPADGKCEFLDVPQDSYSWNVTLEVALGGFDPSLFKTGDIVSDGPDATANVKVGNIDWEDDDDDLEATVLDINDDPAVGLNFTLVFQGNSTVYTETTLGANGSVTFWDIPEDAYTWQVIVPSGDYLGTVIVEGNFQSNGTQQFSRQTLSQIIGDPDYYDLEVIAYMETSLAAIEGVLVNVTFYNGTLIDAQTTPSNGTVLFADLPIAFINVSITYLGVHIGASPHTYNLTDVSFDIRAPVVTGPNDFDVLLWETNVTLTWQLEDEYPSAISVLVNGVEKASQAWNVTLYEYTFNLTDAVPSFEIDQYEVQLTATDQNSKSTDHIVIVTVYENVTPTIEGPEDTEFIFPETGHTLSWNVTDDYPDKYVVTRNGEEHASGSVNPDLPVIVIGIDGLSIGQYTFTLFVNDTSGNSATDDVIVHVLNDDVAPVITYTPPDFEYTQGVAILIRNWTATDDFMATYTITVDNILVVDETWDSETIEFDFAALSVGTHEVVLTVYDVGGNSATSTVIVTVTVSDALTIIMVAGISVAAVILVGIAVWYVRYR